MQWAPWAWTKYGKRLEQPMPATVVIFSCHIFRFSISLKYSASTEKSPQPGHHVGWSATISFLVNPLRSADGETTATSPLPLRGGTSVTGALMFLSKRSIIENYSLRIPAATLVLARSRISLTFHVKPSVLFTPRIFGSQYRARNSPAN